ncbi:MAG TPA: PP2C family protein-serine/threonine phosphatase [Terracidiphilus sp.]
MPGRRRAFLTLFIIAALISLAFAAPAPALPASSEPVAEIHLGDSVAALNGPWKFRVGDSPLDPTTGKPLWSEAGFDDSAWESVDLTVPTGSFDPIAGTSGYLPGWTARGHKGYWGYAWYRIRVRVDSRPGVKLALAGPSDVDDIYQAFDDGMMIGSFGNFSGSEPTIFTTRPEMFELPQESVSAASERVLSFRVYMEPYTLSQLDDVGGFHNPPLLGEHAAIAAQNQVKWDELYRSYAGNLIEALTFTLLGVVALSLVLFDRTDPVYLWIGALLLVIAVSAYINVFSTWTEWVPYVVTAPIRLSIVVPLTYVGWLMVWRVWFRLRRPTWVPWLVLALLPVLMLSSAIGQNLFFVLVQPGTENVFHIISLVVRLALAALLLWTVFQAIMEQGLEGWVAVPAILLAGIAEFSAELGYFHIIPTFFPLGFQFSTRQLANLFLVFALSLLLLRRLIKSIRRQRQIALDVKSAQEVQQVILPEDHTSLPGFEVESEYRPALEVGGDFFQVIPNSVDGSLLIVAGDVAGKGLKAGMLVALLVGAIRTVVQFKADPAVLLDALNKRLIGRGDAFATCLALRIDVDGSVTLVNAGHLAPYLNGKALSLEGSLPLGMLDKPEFSLLRFELHPADRLMLLSDGVAEATDPEGRLFGFDRVQELLRSTTSAAEIANAAQAFGQQDDISVISVTRTGVLAATA